MSNSTKDQWVRRMPYSITIDQFESQMNYLYENEYQTLTLQELLPLATNCQFKKNQNLDRSVVITFDDGYVDNYLYAYPILKECKFKGTFFVIVNKIGSTQFLSWDQLLEMQDQGFEIQSHTLNHKPLESLSSHLIKVELEDSRKILERRLGKAVRFISFPHGSYNKVVLQLAKNLGYCGGCTSNIGYFEPSSNPFKIKRIAIRRNYDILHFQKLIKRNGTFFIKVKFLELLKTYLAKLIGIKNYQRLYNKFYNIDQAENYLVC